MHTYYVHCKDQSSFKIHLDKIYEGLSLKIYYKKTDKKYIYEGNIMLPQLTTTDNLHIWKIFTNQW